MLFSTALMGFDLLWRSRSFLLRGFLVGCRLLGFEINTQLLLFRMSCFRLTGKCGEQRTQSFTQT
ncbi:hypothetical protein B217_01433 [Bifidobacterium bifidum IPLA 20015]|nr:hypothetical protein B217_01433 [Bifidobacterium bifidum IPLA 20015]